MYLIFPTTRGQPFSLSNTQHNVEEGLALYELRDLDAEGDDNVNVEFNDQVLILSFATPRRTSESSIIAEMSPVKDLFLFKGSHQCFR